MGQVIEGKVYDTRTAELVHEWSNGHYPGDFHRTEEALYRTPRGAYFLYGEGGAPSRYSVPVGDMRAAGSAIRPLTEAEALAWLEGHEAAAHVIEDLFAVEEA